MSDDITVRRAGSTIEGGDNDWRVNYIAEWSESGLIDAITPALDIGGPSLFDGALTVEALDGTLPTLDLVVETSPNGSTGWVTAKAYTQATGATAENPLPYPVHRYVRINRNYGGTVTAATVSLAGIFMK